MTDPSPYQLHSDDTDFMLRYAEYQQRYQSRLRESEKKMLQLISERQTEHASPTLLDVGCSTGNFLQHVQGVFPHFKLTGCDLVEEILAQNRLNSELAEIEFIHQDLLTMELEERYDFITAHAVLFMFQDREFEQALQSLHRALKPQGHLIVYDFYHPFQQNLAILEKSKHQPDGMMLHFRAMSDVGQILDKAGFRQYDFQPFDIPIELKREDTYSDNQDGFENLLTYTEQLASGSRLMFRGALYQPWCHLTATK